MSMLEFLPMDEGSSCDKKAVAPEVFQEYLEVAELTGDVAVDLLAQIATDDPAAYAGYVVNKGCKALQLDITYLDGDDCDTCTSDTLVPVVKTVLVPKNAKYQLPAGYVSLMQVTTGEIAADGSFTAEAVPVGQTQDIYYDGCYTPCCSGAVLVP